MVGSKIECSFVVCILLLRLFGDFSLGIGIYIIIIGWKYRIVNFLIEIRINIVW